MAVTMPKGNPRTTPRGGSAMLMTELHSPDPVCQVRLNGTGDHVWLLNPQGVARQYALARPGEPLRRVDCRLDLGGVAWHPVSGDLLLAGSALNPQGGRGSGELTVARA